MMYLALSYDHRIVDGKGAVTFLVRVKEALEDPRRLLMDLVTPRADGARRSPRPLAGGAVRADGGAGEPRSSGRSARSGRATMDRAGAPLAARTARLARALDNHFEGLILFTLAVVVVTLGDAASPFTAACAWTYLAARVPYVPAYAFGLAPWRSLVWLIGFLATLAMILAAII